MKPVVTSVPRIWFKHGPCWKWNKNLMQHTLLRWSVTQLGLWPKDLTWAAATHSSKWTGLNRTVDSANILIFHSKTSRCTASWGVLHIKGILERSTQHTQALGHTTGVLYMLHQHRGTICYLLHVLFTVINSTLWMSVQGEKITLRNWEPHMEHSPTETGLTRKSVKTAPGKFQSQREKLRKSSSN